MSALAVTPLRGDAAAAELDDLARLRIAVFRAWPYLYEGDLDYERGYLAAFAKAPDALLAVARADGEIVGASTAMPLGAAEPAIRAPFEAAGRDLAGVFYFGESVLDPAWRGRGVGHAFFDAREAHARACGAREAVFCAVERPADHPLRDPSHSPLDAFWAKRGYAPSGDLVCRLAWRDVGERDATEKPLRFWAKTF